MSQYESRKQEFQVDVEQLIKRAIRSRPERSEGLVRQLAALGVEAQLLVLQHLRKNDGPLYLADAVLLAPSPALLAPLTTLLEDTSDVAATCAIQALGLIHGGGRVLVDLLDRADLLVSTRTSVVRSLAVGRDPDNLPMFLQLAERAAKEGSWGISLEATRAATMLGARDMTHLVRAAWHQATNEQGRIDVLSTAADVLPSDTGTIIAEACEGRVVAVRAAAIRILAEIGNLVAAEALLKAATAGPASTKQEARAAIARVTGWDEVTQLKTWWGQSHRDWADNIAIRWGRPLQPSVFAPLLGSDGQRYRTIAELVRIYGYDLPFNPYDRLPTREAGAAAAAWIAARDASFTPGGLYRYGYRVDLGEVLRDARPALAPLAG